MNFAPYNSSGTAKRTFLAIRNQLISKYRNITPIPKSHIPAAIEKKIGTAKRWSAHLEGVDYWEETEAAVCAGGYAAMSATLEIWPELTESLEVTGGAGTDALSATRQIIEIYPGEEMG